MKGVIVMAGKYLWANFCLPSEDELKSLHKMGDVFFLKDINFELWDRLADIDTLTDFDTFKLAEDLSTFCKENEFILVSPKGTSLFYLLLDRVNRNNDVITLYPYLERVTENQVQPNGKARKVSVLKHAGWLRFGDAVEIVIQPLGEVGGGGKAK